MSDSDDDTQDLSSIKAEWKLGMFWEVGSADGNDRVFLVKDGEFMQTPPIARVLGDIAGERKRQVRLRDQGRFRHTVACSGMTDGERLGVLGEEFGEVCRALQERLGSCNDTHHLNLRRELVQVAAVAAAWVERLDRDAHADKVAA